MSSRQTITSNLPFGLFSSATLSGPMPNANIISCPIFNIDDAGPLGPVDELESEELNQKLFWED